MRFGDAGQAVMLAMMGAMLVAGLVVWLDGGEFHMMPGHGKHGIKESHAESSHATPPPQHSGHEGFPPPESHLPNSDPDFATAEESGDAGPAAGGSHGDR